MAISSSLSIWERDLISLVLLQAVLPRATRPVIRIESKYSSLKLEERICFIAKSYESDDWVCIFSLLFLFPVVALVEHFLQLLWDGNPHSGLPLFAWSEVMASHVIDKEIYGFAYGALREFPTGSILVSTTSEALTT